MASDVLPPARSGVRPKLSQRVIAELRRRVVEGQLTESFGVSRTVIREAIAALAADGLVQSRQGARIFVVENPTSSLGALAIDKGSRVSTALHVLEIRLAIEVEGAGLAAERRNPAQEADMVEAFFEFERLLREAEPTGPADLAFHRAIAEATGNPFYVEMLDVLGRKAIPCDVTSPASTELVQSDDYQRQLQREHHAILTAISAGAVDDARESMRVHLANSQDRYRARLHERQAHYAQAAGPPRV
jgi:DNA-binding FadR family transcriptional regulator